MIDKEDFTPKMIGADAPAQNGIAESPNKYLANMMCCLLYTANLGPEYWPYALVHAVYIKKLPRSYIKTTPFKALASNQPDLTNLKVFGSRLYAKNPGKCDAKLDHHTSNGIFVEYTATTQNVYYIEKASNNVKIGTNSCLTRHTSQLTKKLTACCISSTTTWIHQLQQQIQRWKIHP